MKKKSMKKISKQEKFYPYDLFGEIPVTVPELYEWVRIVAPHIPEGRRTDRYIEGYNVAEKVAAAKRDGRF